MTARPSTTTAAAAKISGQRVLQAGQRLTAFLVRGVAKRRLRPRNSRSGQTVRTRRSRPSGRLASQNGQRQRADF